MNLRRLRRPWLLAVLCVLILVLLAEGTLRLFPGTLPVQLRQIIRADPGISTVAHPYIGHLHRPTRDSDPYGFRNEWPWPEVPGIITLGDSLTFGNGVEPAAAWPAILARAFPERGVVNLALGASGPQQYSRVFETFGVKLRARLILIGFFARYDFWDAAMFEQWLKSGAGGNYLVWRDSGRPASVSLSLRQPMGRLARSVVWRGQRVARTTYLGTLLRHTAGHPGARPQSGTQVYEAPDGTRLELQPEDFSSTTRYGQPGTAVFRHVLAAVERIHSLAHENGGSAVVLLLPSKEEVYLPLLRESSLDPTAPLRAALDERGIPYLDLLDDFRRSAADGDVLFFATDSPLTNARGHALIADRVISHLRRHAQEHGL